MSQRTFVVQYTHQKQKKQKTWQDGTLVVREGERRGSLRDSSGKLLDSVPLPASFEGLLDDELESDRYRLFPFISACILAWLCERFVTLCAVQ